MDLSGTNRSRLIERLIGARPQSSAFDRICADPDNEITFDRSDWVGCYVDQTHYRTWPDDGLSATRAITKQGRMIWLVRSTTYRRAYHSRAETATGAVDDARRAWARRAEMRALRPELYRVVRALRTGRLSFSITVDDAYASPLCEEGVDGFLRAIGMARVRVFPGWFIAWCFALDRQVGFVIWEAYQRHLRESTPAAPREA